MNFVPNNELEENIIQAMNGEIPIEELVEKMFSSQIVALFDRAILDGKIDEESQPLVVTNFTGLPLVAVFSSLERATPITEQAGEYKYALLVDFQWLLRGVADGVGLVINVGWPVGFEMSPEGVVELKQHL